MFIKICLLLSDVDNILNGLQRMLHENYMDNDMCNLLIRHYEQIAKKADLAKEDKNNEAEIIEFDITIQDMVESKVFMPRGVNTINVESLEIKDYI